MQHDYIGTGLISTEEISRPVFILGCGRSGTTILGTTLSKHNKITYLHERRDLWFDAYPETDIWTPQATARKGKMALTSENVESVKSQKLRRLFNRETIKTSKPVLVEKLPINNFRVEFIHSVFPDARFIHIYRNGLEVARSIQKLCEKGHWFGSNEYKWKQLIDYSKSSHVTADLHELCGTYFYKGLFEWRLSTESAVNFLSSLHNDKYLEISYARFTKEPIETIKRVLDYMELNDDSSFLEYVSKNISRKTSQLDGKLLTETESKIGGKLLPLSMDSTISRLTNAY
ncbi:MAG: sulfotransferase [Desulfobacteraceae bacterium]|nr:sulfotransferase [Desulfobacteraceae bacterium]